MYCVILIYDLTCLSKKWCRYHLFMISVSLLLSAIESRPTKKTFLFAADIKMRKCIVDKNMYISRCEKRGIFFQ